MPILIKVEALYATQHADAQPPQRAVGPACAAPAAPTAPLARHRLILLEGKKKEVFCVQHSGTKKENKALVSSMPSWVP